MPIVPGRPNLISTEVPGVSSGSEYAGILNKSISNLGGQVADVALNIAEKIQGFENNNAVLTAQQEFQKSNLDMMNTIKNSSKFSDGYVKADDYAPGVNESYEMVVDPQAVGGKRKKSVTEYYSEKMKERVRELHESMPTYVAQQQAKQALSDNFSSGVSSAWGVEQEYRVKSFKTDLDNGARIISDQFIATPDTFGPGQWGDTFYSATDNQVLKIEGAVKTGIFNSVDGTIKKNELLSAVSESNIDGMIHALRNKIVDSKARLKLDPMDTGALIDVEAEKARILAVLDGRDPTSQARSKNGKYTLANSLTEAQQDTLRGRVASLTVGDGKGLDVSALNKWRENAIKRIENSKGKAPVVPVVTEYLKLAAPYIAGDKKAGNEVLSDVADIVAAQGLGSIDSLEFRTGTLEKKQAMKAVAERNVKRIVGQLRVAMANNPEVAKFGSELDGKALESLTRAFDKSTVNDTMDWREDPAAALAKWSMSDPNGVGTLRNKLITSVPETISSPAFIKVARANLVETARVSGVEGRFLDKALSRELVTMLQSQDIDASRKVGSLFTLYKTDPTLHAKVINQLVEDGLSPAYRLMTQMNPVMAKEFQANLTDVSKDEIDTFKSKIGTDSDYKDFVNKVNPTVQKMVNALVSEAPSDTRRVAEARVLRDFFRNMVIRNINSPTGATSPDAAAKNVYDSMFGNVHVYQLTNKLEKPYFVRVPKTLSDGSTMNEADQSSVQAFINQSMTTEFAKSLGFQPPPDWAKKKKVDANRIYETVAAQGSLVPDPKNPEMWSLVIPSPFTGGTMQPIYITDKAGRKKPVQIPIQKIKELGAIRDKMSFKNQFMSVMGMGKM